jgi:hypothetical protein
MVVKSTYLEFDEKAFFIELEVLERKAMVFYDDVKPQNLLERNRKKKTFFNINQLL